MHVFWPKNTLGNVFFFEGNVLGNVFFVKFSLKPGSFSRILIPGPRPKSVCRVMYFFGGECIGECIGNVKYSVKPCESTQRNRAIPELRLQNQCLLQLHFRPSPAGTMSQR